MSRKIGLHGLVYYGKFWDWEMKQHDQLSFVSCSALRCRVNSSCIMLRSTSTKSVQDYQINLSHFAWKIQQRVNRKFSIMLWNPSGGSTTTSWGSWRPLGIGFQIGTHKIPWLYPHPLHPWHQNGTANSNYLRNRSDSDINPWLKTAP